MGSKCQKMVGNGREGLESSKKRFGMTKIAPNLTGRARNAEKIGLNTPGLGKSPKLIGTVKNGQKNRREIPKLSKNASEMPKSALSSKGRARNGQESI